MQDDEMLALCRRHLGAIIAHPSVTIACMAVITPDTVVACLVTTTARFGLPPRTAYLVVTIAPLAIIATRLAIVVAHLAVVATRLREPSSRAEGRCAWWGLRLVL
ncbi:hypothetical protein GUJ93_ZPchr0003g18161 [Zizania palustris]|uniref:Uncharacterized protein n=1 Tax=Zizania palustris TaxID=103762 RepID=A0A8J5VWP2_ZIZPA|nr:hypothetical protein GUJ93_ZPchr0003g18161 [Zizania palustris]